MRSPFENVDDFPPFQGFPKEGIRFLGRLRKNNNRPWFEAHKQEYEEHVKLPMQCLLASLRPSFEHFAPEYDLNPKRSLFRIYRDTRFSKDKTPYKTHVAAHAVLRGKAKGFVGSGYYIHIEPGECYVGAGIYMPESNQLKNIRKSISKDGASFLAIVHAKPFVRRFGKLEGDRLKRMPKGYDENDPLAEFLRLKQFFVGVSLPETKSFRPSFVSDVAAICESAVPFVRFLNAALTGSGNIF